jgi:hypothetical protein
MATTLNAQYPKVIQGGAGNAGLLEATINADTLTTGDRIYELVANQFYIQQGPIVVKNVDGTIIIRGQSGGSKPVIIKQPLADVNIGTSTINSSLTFQNVQYCGMETDGNLPWQLFLITGVNHHLLVEDCLFEFANGTIFDMSGVTAGAEIVIRGNYFRDLNDFSQWWQARVVECKNPVDTFIFENNTVTGAGLMVLGQECLFEYSVINHNTIINNHKYPFLNQYWKEVYFTNNLFVNSNMVGEDMENVANSGQDPDKLLMGISGVDTIETSILIQGKFKNPITDTTFTLTAEVDGLDDIIYYAADNVVTYSTTLDNYYKGNVDGVFPDVAPASYLNWGGLGTGPWHILNVPGIWANERTEALIAAWPNIKDENNSIYEISLVDLGLVTNPLLQAAADTFVKWNRNAWGVPNITSPTDYSVYYFGDHNPATVPGVETETAAAGAGGITKISDMIEDFSYTANLVSKSDGLRIGALHWNNEAFDSKASLANVKKAYNGIHYSVNPIKGESMFVYPNPAQDILNVKGSRIADITITNLDGRIVRSAKNVSSVNVSDLSNGMYIVTIKVGNNVSTQKVLIF